MEAREPLTIRFPRQLLTQARELKEKQESLNDVVVSAVDREMRRRRGLRVYEEILKIQEDVRRTSGVHPDSDPLIRALREGTEPYV
jgi:hypothetical protein